ncbi:Uncharacterized conserved protein, DUF305 family [Streptosporangium subroseum]|uniref:Uncharacterized conserved protein, DUF305 family n=1 Tax=Streptosporangium subroseum TaxID=106412 RepID=A0A239NNT1_9ACTN|nr:DUF305 domain-containing protein [Streptosporangium subroseum]SNT56505.1 Uncharacterized conserved protein, DUF305 family [Streptosporangium subroseum]
MKATAVGMPLAALVAALLAAGCGGPASEHAHHPPAPSGQSAVSSPPVVSPASPAASTPSGAFNGTDVGWMQLMIPMDEQLLSMLEMAPKRTSNPEVIQLAKLFAADHRAELLKLRALMDRSGAPKTNVHEGHDMPGMVTAADLGVIDQTKGAAFDRLFAKNMREHLEQGILLCRGEQGAGADQATRELAGNIEKARAAQLDRLDG